MYFKSRSSPEIRFFQVSNSPKYKQPGPKNCIFRPKTALSNWFKYKQVCIMTESAPNAPRSTFFVSDYMTYYISVTIMHQIRPNALSTNSSVRPAGQPPARSQGRAPWPTGQASGPPMTHTMNELQLFRKVFAKNINVCIFLKYNIT